MRTREPVSTSPESSPGAVGLTDEAPMPDPGPFGIDGPEYTDRDREMFVLGFEYRQIQEYVRRYPNGPVLFCVHEGNADRVRRECEWALIRCEVQPVPEFSEPGWVRVVLYPRANP